MILSGFIKSTVLVAGSNSPAGSMKKIIINFLQLQSLAVGFPLQWPPMVISMFETFGITASANVDVFVLECIVPSNYFEVLPVVYQKTIMITMMPLLFMLFSGVVWWFNDRMCVKKTKPMKHTPVPKELYIKHKAKSEACAKMKQLEEHLQEMQKHDDIPDEIQILPSDGSLDNDTAEDFGFVYRHAIHAALDSGIDIQASFRHFANLENDEEFSEHEKKGAKNETGEAVQEMSTSAFEHMLGEWGSPPKDDAELWAMLQRVDEDGSGWISVPELQAYERSTYDRWILSATVVAYMFCKSCGVILHVLIPLSPTIVTVESRYTFCSGFFLTIFMFMYPISSLRLRSNMLQSWIHVNFMQTRFVRRRLLVIFKG